MLVLRSEYRFLIYRLPLPAEICEMIVQETAQQLREDAREYVLAVHHILFTRWEERKAIFEKFTGYDPHHFNDALLNSLFVRVAGLTIHSLGYRYWVQFCVCCKRMQGCYPCCFMLDGSHNLCEYVDALKAELKFLIDSSAFD